MQMEAFVNDTHSVVKHCNTPCTFAVNKCMHDDQMQEIGKEGEMMDLAPWLDFIAFKIDPFIKFYKVHAPVKVPF